MALYGGATAFTRPGTRRPTASPLPRVAAPQVGTLPTLSPQRRRQASLPEEAMSSRGYSSGASTLLDTFHRSRGRRSPAISMLL